MKTALLAISLSLGILVPQPSHAAPPVAIYDTQADGAKQIAAAVARAKKEGKQVLVVMGANWCPWCRELHKVFETREAVKTVLNTRYVLIFIDVDGDHNRGVDIDLGDLSMNGIPQIVVLDAEGKKVQAKDPEGWEKDGSYDTARMLQFLNAAR